jgi:RimJ/RimL family protein N-acetyltransferase
MTNKKSYLFKSERLGFRQWQSSDLIPFARMNADAEVMEFFPSILSREETESFIQRMQDQFIERGYCYYAVDELASSEFIGFIGLSYKTYLAEFTPCVDIGWRISRAHWNQGYATEGAKRCLDFAFHELGVQKIYAVCPKLNMKSERIMIKIGMTKVGEFKHPFLVNNEHLVDCVLYLIKQRH